MSFFDGETLTSVCRLVQKHMILLTFNPLSGIIIARLSII